MKPGRLRARSFRPFLPAPLRTGLDTCRIIRLSSFLVSLTLAYWHGCRLPRSWIMFRIVSAVRISRTLRPFHGKPASLRRWAALTPLCPCRRLYWVGTGRVAFRYVSPCPPLDPYVRLSPHTAHDRGILRERSISPAPRCIPHGQLARSLGTCVLFPDPLPQALRHVRSLPTLGLLWPI